mmetsp:Transcript_10986/g.35843  ORF Transcript_10986/g.35843 Transcript_10986/m.35843 type:complete len:321 (+) Transcript_10986:327-1289(+)
MCATSLERTRGATRCGRCGTALSLTEVSRRRFAFCRPYRLSDPQTTHRYLTQRSFFNFIISTFKKTKHPASLCPLATAVGRGLVCGGVRPRFCAYRARRVSRGRATYDLFLLREGLHRVVHDAVEQTDHRVDAADDGANLGDEGGERLRLLLHHHLDGRDVVVEDGVRHHLRIHVRVGLALVPLELARPVLVVVCLVEVGLGDVAGEVVVVEGDDLEVVLERRELLVHHEAHLVQARPLLDRDDLVSLRWPLVCVCEEELVHVVRDVHHARVERVRVGLGGDAERAGHTRDLERACELAALACQRVALDRASRSRSLVRV